MKRVAFARALVLVLLLPTLSEASGKALLEFLRALAGESKAAGNAYKGFWKNSKALARKDHLWLHGTGRDTRLVVHRRNSFNSYGVKDGKLRDPSQPTRFITPEEFLRGLKRTEILVSEGSVTSRIARALARSRRDRLHLIRESGRTSRLRYFDGKPYTPISANVYVGHGKLSRAARLPSRLRRAARYPSIRRKLRRRHKPQVLNLVKDEPTAKAFSKLIPRKQRVRLLLKKGLTRARIRQVLAECQGQTLVVLGHAEGSSIVIRQGGNIGEEIFRISLRELDEMAARYAVDVVAVGCGTAKASAIGVTGKLNSVEAVRRVAEGLKTQSLYGLLAKVSGPNQLVLIKDARILAGRITTEARTCKRAATPTDSLLPQRIFLSLGIEKIAPVPKPIRKNERRKKQKKQKKPALPTAKTCENCRPTNASGKTTRPSPPPQEKHPNYNLVAIFLILGVVVSAIALGFPLETGNSPEEIK